MSYKESHCLGCETCFGSCSNRIPITVFVCEKCGTEMYHEPDVEAGADTFFCFDCAESMDEAEDDEEY